MKRLDGCLHRISSTISSLAFSKSISSPIINPLRSVSQDFLFSSMLGYDESTRGPELGRLAETAAYNHLLRMTKTYFWRDVQGNKMDLVCLTRGGPLPIEVKYQASIYKSDAKGLLRFCDVHGVKRALLVTKDKEGSMAFGDVRIGLLPLWSFLSSSEIVDKTLDR